MHLCVRVRGGGGSGGGGTRLWKVLPGKKVSMSKQEEMFTLSDIIAKGNRTRWRNRQKHSIE